jgi:hypothetical protein
VIDLGGNARNADLGCAIIDLKRRKMSLESNANICKQDTNLGTRGSQKAVRSRRHFEGA